MHVAERHAGVEGSGDEGVTQGMRADRLGATGPASDPADDPAGPVTVEALAVSGDEDRAAGPFADGQVDGSGGARRERDGDGLAAFRTMVSVRCPRSTRRASMSAPIASETRRPLSASSEISACSAAGPSPAATRSAPTSLRSRPNDMGFVVDPRAADLDCRRMGDQAFLLGVAVDAGHSAQSSGRWWPSSDPELRGSVRRSRCRFGGPRTARDGAGRRRR